ncbi:MAG: ATP-binding cassette domain-containing protein, partial [Clostridiales bacterium]|nr:ATP-binding cassette domain-containing protein [Candidatus Apopatocola equi]
MEILAVRDLSFSYPTCSEPTLKHLSFSVEAGDYTVICGPTGSGKSTLLRMLKRELTPLGELEGSVAYMGKELQELDALTAAAQIGFVMQRPEQQLVTDKVWHELAFGLENMGLPQAAIRRRVSEMAAYFDMEDWFDKRVDELSGGQKQLLNLAAVMVMQPQVLILDEPTSQLDPIASADFLETVGRLNRETGVTVLLVEHQLESVVPRCDKLMVMEKGRIRYYDEPRRVCEQLREFPAMLEAMPAAVRLFNSFPPKGECPLNVREGRRWVEEHFADAVKALPEKSYTHSANPALELKDLWFRYSREGKDVLRGTDITVYEGEIFCILGGNGSGKSTTISNAAGLLKPYSGTIRVFGKKIQEYKNQSLYRDCLSLLPQDVQTVFLCNTVREELRDAGAAVEDLPYDISHLLDKHPYDLSGGEQQLVALAKVLSTRPRLLLLDEPTKGLDAYAKRGISDILRRLRAEGMT